MCAIRCPIRFSLGTVFITKITFNSLNQTLIFCLINFVFVFKKRLFNFQHFFFLYSQISQVFHRVQVGNVDLILSKPIWSNQSLIECLTAQLVFYTPKIILLPFPNPSHTYLFILLLNLLPRNANIWRHRFLPFASDFESIECVINLVFLLIINFDAEYQFLALACSRNCGHPWLLFWSPSVRKSCVLPVLETVIALIACLVNICRLFFLLLFLRQILVKKHSDPFRFLILATSFEHASFLKTYIKI